jgi:hypothetical protein
MTQYNNGGSKHLWNAGQFLRGYKAQHHRRRQTRIGESLKYHQESSNSSSSLSSSLRVGFWNYSHSKNCVQNLFIICCLFNDEAYNVDGAMINEEWQGKDVERNDRFLI